MKILPVLDLLKGVVVHGIAGDRGSYRPIHSQLTDHTSPLGIAQALHESYGLEEFYVADLDGIQTRRIDVATYTKLRDAGFRMIVDAGVRELREVENLIVAGVEAVIVALETNPSAQLLEQVLERYGPDKVVFSLDLKQGQPLGTIAEIPFEDPLELVIDVINRGMRQIIVLDLHAVGSGTGPVTTDLCRAIRDLSSDVQLITGGGVRGEPDLQRLEEAGVDGVLIATALHNGSLSPTVIQSFRS